MNKFLNIDKTNFLYGILVAVLFAILFCSCGPTREEYDAEQARKIKSGEVIGEYKVEVIDGCEYLTAGFLDNRVITHKGNCKNITHKNK